jgi:hypothetical protein
MGKIEYFNVILNMRTDVELFGYDQKTSTGTIALFDVKPTTTKCEKYFHIQYATPPKNIIKTFSEKLADNADCTAIINTSEGFHHIQFVSDNSKFTHSFNGTQTTQTLKDASRHHLASAFLSMHDTTSGWWTETLKTFRFIKKEI